MTVNPSENGLNPVNELAKERNRAAAERTLTAWIQVCAPLISFGIAVDQLFSRPNPLLIDSSSAQTLMHTSTVSLSFIAVGILLLLIGIIQYSLEVRSLARQDYLIHSNRFWNRLVLLSVISFGLFSLLIVLLRII